MAPAGLPGSGSERWGRHTFASLHPASSHVGAIRHLGVESVWACSRRGWAEPTRPGSQVLQYRLSGRWMHAVRSSVVFRLHRHNRDVHKGADTNKPSRVEVSPKSLMSDYGLRVWISMRCGSASGRNVFIILCNDSLDNNSFSSEGISIKTEESIKMLYARIYKLGNFLDYCNHLQNWLFRCGIDRFLQWSLTTSTFPDIKSLSCPRPHCPPPSCKVRRTFKGTHNDEYMVLLFRGEPLVWAGESSLL